MIWHSNDVRAVCDELQVDPSMGLSSPTAAARLNEYGENRLQTQTVLSLPQAFAGQLRSPLTILPLAAAGIMLVLGLYRHLLKGADLHWQLPVCVAVLTVLSALFGGIRRHRASAAGAAAHTRSALDVRVLRDGEEQTCATHALVPGDILRLAMGDLVPADCRLIDAHNLRCDESHLTEATLPVEKSAEAVFEDITPLAQRTNMLYVGTAITSGTATAVVVATGERSEMTHSAPHEQAARDLPMTKTARRLQLWWTAAVALLSVCALMVGLMHNADRWTVLLTAVTLLMAAIPQNTTDLLTQLTLRSARRTAGHHAHLYRPETAQTLGQVSVVCAEQETLYQSEGIALRRAFVAHRAVDLAGPVPKAPGLAQLLRLAALNARPCDPMDAAILGYLTNTDIDQAELLVDMPRVGELPTAAGHKTGVHLAGEQSLILVSGGWRTLLPLCTKGNPEEWTAAATAMEEDGLQVMAITYRLTDTAPAVYTAAELERDLTCAGLLGLQMPLRPHVKEAARCISSVRMLLFSNESPETAAATARLIGLTDAPNVATADEIESLTEEALDNAVQTYTVYCGLDTQQKQRILAALQRQGETVAVTACHSDQADLLTAADVGFARGPVATDVAKQAADVLLTEDSYTAVMAALWEGRRLQKQIRCAFAYWVLCSLVIAGIGVAGLFGWWPLHNQAILMAGLHLVLMAILPIPFDEKRNISNE